MGTSISSPSQDRMAKNNKLINEEKQVIRRHTQIIPSRNRIRLQSLHSSNRQSFINNDGIPKHEKPNNTVETQNEKQQGQIPDQLDADIKNGMKELQQTKMNVKKPSNIGPNDEGEISNVPKLQMPNKLFPHRNQIKTGF